MYLVHLLTFPDVKLGFKYGFGLDKMGWVVLLKNIKK